MTEQELTHKINGELRRCASCYHSISESRLAILALIKEAGYVRLSKDQSLPKPPVFYDDWGGESGLEAYGQAQQDMLKVKEGKAFRKVEL